MIAGGGSPLRALVEELVTNGPVSGPCPFCDQSICVDHEGISHVRPSCLQFLDCHTADVFFVRFIAAVAPREILDRSGYGRLVERSVS